MFELFNWRTENWIYVGREHFSDLTYFLLASLSFSTVMPAVFETAELVRSFGWVERLRPWRRVSPSRSTLQSFLAAGVLLVVLIMVWPKVFYPFIWASVFFILAPINGWLGHRSLLDDLDHRDWRPVVSLALVARRTPAPKAVERPVIKAVHVVHDASAEQLRHLMAPYRDTCDFFLLDTHNSSVWGGTGESFNWRLARDLAQEMDLFLAGGISPENVEEAARIRPYAIDLSSSLESEPGVKDFDKLFDFFEAYRNAVEAD